MALPEQMKKLKVGDHISVKLYPRAETVEAEIKSIKQTSTGTKYRVSFDVRTALITPDQIVEDV